MPILNTKKTAVFLAIGSTPPVPPLGFIETVEPVLVVPEFAQVDINRITGKMNTKTQATDICRTKTSFEIPHIMRTSNKAADALDTTPEYGLLLSCSGFDEVIDTATPGEETVTYNNNDDVIAPISSEIFLDGKKFTFTESLTAASSFDLVVGEPATIKTSVSGYMDSAKPTDESMPAVTLTEEVALIVSCADLVTHDGTCLPLESVNIKFNEEFQDVYTLGGTCGIKSNFISDYALELEAVFYVDSAAYDREATLIESGEAKEIIVKIGLDETSTEVNGKSVVFTAPMSKATVYSDTSNNDLLQRTVTYRLFDDGATPALSIKTGFFN